MIVAASLLAIACQADTQQVVDEAARQAELAKQQTAQAVDAAARQAEVAKQQTKQAMDAAAWKAEVGLAEAREAGERYGETVEQRLEQAKRQLHGSMDEAATEFEQLAAAGKQQANQIGEQIGEAGKSGLDIAPNAIKCDDKPERRVCRIDPELIAQLASEPRVLAREVSLRPGTGATGKGLQLARAQAEGFAAALGLREGDILLELNGAKLDSFGAIRELDGALSGKPEAKLVYEREGQREELTVVQQPH